ncbi:MAG: class I SAM-dependent methyltransferase [Chloroflexi bacterium]|nr:MAG: class I SAM-dependent methyltransferase [Chloroflexota bacterium]
MPDNKTVYAHHGNEYEALIAREDHQGNIPRAIDEIVSVEGLDVLDLGAGTGRLTRMLAPRVKSIRAFDVSSEMLRVCREKLIASGLSNWQVDVADHRQLPVQDHSAELVVSGWSVSYLAVWNPKTWRGEMEKWLGEMKRVLNGGGSIILLESLGTGHESPAELDHLKDFYRWLNEAGFQKKWIRTDYRFESLDEAEYLARFFFGDELGDKVRQNNWVILPECTGVWWKRFEVL